jgi:cation transport regulator ChaC
LYFAYGSNMDSSQMAARCPTATRHATAELEGWRFLINSRGVASIEPAPGHRVRGVLWNLEGADELSLDRCEGVASGIYFKEQVQTRLDGGGEAQALVYVAADNELGEPRAGYLERIVRGAIEAGLPEDYASGLRTWATVE